MSAIKLKVIKGTVVVGDEEFGVEAEFTTEKATADSLIEAGFAVLVEADAEAKAKPAKGKAAKSDDEAL